MNDRRSFCAARGLSAALLALAIALPGCGSDTGSAGGTGGTGGTAGSGGTTTSGGTGGSGGTTTSGGTGGSGGTTSSGPECETANDCPVPPTPCIVAVCVGGACGTQNVPMMEILDQTPGDCHADACDGAGNVESVVDDSDVPNDEDGCTKDTCTNGTPMHTALPPSGPEVIYDAVTKGLDTGGSGFNNLQQVGQLLHLAGSERAVKEITLGLRSGLSVPNDVTFRVHLYPLGVDGPGAPLWTSPDKTVAGITSTPTTFTFTVPNTGVADDVVIAVETLQGDLLVSQGVPPPSVGTKGAAYYLPTAGPPWTSQEQSMTFAWKLTAGCP